MINETSNTIIVSKTALLWLLVDYLSLNRVSMDPTQVSCYIIFDEKPRKNLSQVEERHEKSLIRLK